MENQNIFIGPEESKEEAQLLKSEIMSELSMISDNLDILITKRQLFLVADILLKLNMIYELATNLSCDAETYASETVFDFERFSENNITDKE